MKSGRAGNGAASSAGAAPRRTHHVSRRTSILIGMFVFCGTTVAGFVYAGSDGQPTPGADGGRVSGSAPDFTKPVAVQQGGTFSLPSYRGHPVLLSFLDTQAAATKAGNPSRAQVVFLKSMERQNQAYGLRIVIVDAADVVGKPEPSLKTLINYTFDQALPSSILVIGDQGGTVARAYGVTTVPTTFLIDQRGVIKQRWDRFAPAAELEFAIRPLVGRSALAYPTPSSIQPR
jgi:peroxiredoxin